MYVFPDMIDMGMPEGGWKTPEHRVVAQNVLLCNSRITSRDILTDNCAIINKIYKKKIKTVTYGDLFDLGVELA